MRLFALGSSCVVLLWCGASARSAQDAPPTATTSTQTSPLPGPAPRQPIAGLQGYTSDSHLVFVAEPAQTYRFECCEAFPARSRWCLEVPDERAAGRRVLQYRFGEQAYSVPAFGGKSVEVVGPDRLDQLLHTELRRALFLFPDGVAWQREGKLWRADLGTIGLLLATVGEDGRPTSVSSLTAGEEIRDSYKELGWQTIEGRTWPANASLYQEQGKVWDEQVLAVRTSTYYVESFFRPPDRRELARGASGASDPPRAIDLQPAVRKRVLLDKAREQSLDEVFADVARITDALAPEIAAGGLELGAFYYLELGEAGEAVALHLHASPWVPGDRALPEGWERVASRPAVALLLRSPKHLTATTLAHLRAAAGVEAGTGVVLLQLGAKDPQEAPAKLVLPLEN